MTISRKMVYGGLTGPRGLVLAIIFTALRDAKGKNEAQSIDAWDYFMGPLYRAHLRMLGQKTDILPEALFDD